MYESFYGLTSKPFQLNPDPSFYFGSRQHRRAMAYLDYGLHQNEGFIVITGEVGAGKTTLVRNLLNNLDSNQVVAAHLVSTQLDAEDTLRMVGAAFGVRTLNVDKSEVLMSLEAFLVSISRKGKRGLLIVDEAQNLTPCAVEELRMLSNFQLETHALLQSFLIGQPEFRSILQSPHMEQLRQRVIAACHIGPMDSEETRGYVEHRLTCAGLTGKPLFDDDAYHAIFEVSEGIPRRINSLCDRILLSGYLAGKKSFGRAEVVEVAREIHDETRVPKLTLVDGDSAASSQRLNARPLTDIDTSQLHFDAETADEATRLIAGLSATQLGARLTRIERSILRLEQNNSAALLLLQQLVDAVRTNSPDRKDRA
jgi:putative secretion ATPase (PEP-CTERM system associated)